MGDRGILNQTFPTPPANSSGMSSHYDFSVVGAGIAGLTVARALAARGARVIVFDRGVAGQGASRAAAGMLAPLIEARLEERPLAEFGREALEYYPGFVAELENQTGIDVGYRAEGTLYIAVDRDQLSLLRHSFQEQHRLGLPVEWMSGYDIREMEPYVAPGVSGGIFSSLDRQVHNRRLIQALLESIRHPGVRLVESIGPVQLKGFNGGVTVETSDATFASERAVIAPGADGSVLNQVDHELAQALRPVKGQILRLDQSALPVISRIVRTPAVYLVPKSDGTIVVGASSEDKGFDSSVTAGEVYELLRSARECVPAVHELPLVETCVGFRPATIDHMPILGETDTPGIYVAAGYYRHGILFAPLAAAVLADHLCNSATSSWLEQFSPARFHERAA